MTHTYFMGASSGKSRKTGENWFSIQLLRENRWGNVEIKPLFIPSEERWKKLVSACPPVGAAVLVTVDIDGIPVSVSAVKDVPALDLR